MHSFSIKRSIYIVLLLMPTLSKNALAMPLLITDDAEVVAARSCQIELAYNLHAHSNHAATLNPACSVGQQVEVGLSLNSDEGQQSYAIQLKRPLFTHANFSIASTVEFEDEQQQNYWHLNIPSSFYLSNQWQLDANIGFRQLNHQADPIVAIASTYAVNTVKQFSVELSKANSEDKISAQLLYHYHILPEKLTLYTAYGQKLKADPPAWFGLGLSWTPASF